ncbi:MAG: hypothetical protein ACJA1A_002402 [Saprospiraceae bacterium]|jgi:hypothetical protein
MTPKKVQQILFCSLVALSLVSSVYINGEAKQLKTQGFDVSYFSPEDAEAILPDVQFVGLVVEKLREFVIR